MNAVAHAEFGRLDIRPDYERARRALRNELPALAPADAATRIATLAALLEQRVEGIKSDLLATSLCWNDDHQVMAAWLSAEHQELFAMAQATVERSGDCDRDSPGLLMATVALHQWSEALKWDLRRGLRDLQPLHAMMAAARRHGSERRAVRIGAAGRERTATVETLYVRALLLDRFGGGSLTRPQLEILDAWLCEWAPALQLGRQPAEGRCFHIDMDSRAGLRQGAAAPGANVLYLPLQGLVQCRRDVVAQLHRGHLVPQHGCVSQMRLEEHVAVLEHTARAFEAVGSEQPRAERRPGAKVRVETWVGAREILARALAARAEDGAKKVAGQVLSVMAVSTPTRVGMLADDPSRRYLWLNDESGSGFGFEAMSSDAEGIEVGELLGWRKSPDGPCAIGRVARRMPGSSAGQVYFGVELLTAAAQPVKLVEISGDCELAEHHFIYVPGDDDSGRRDAFLATESQYHDATIYEARIDGRVFRLRMDRLRQRGRGWVLAGFEVLPAEFGSIPLLPEVAEVPCLRAVESADDDAGLEEALAREMGSRLLG